MIFQRFKSNLQESPLFEEKRFWVGLSIGITWSIVMYLFLQVWRSAIFFVFGYNNIVITIINFPEYRFYSFIIAFFSIIFGAYQFLEFTCYKNRTFFKRGFQKKVMLFNQRNIIWTSLFICFKFLTISFLTLLVGLVSVWKIYSSGWWISVLLSLFLYFYFWNNLKRIFPNALKYSLVFFPITLSLAFGLSQIKPVDMESYQQFGLRHTLHYTKQIDVPISTHPDRIYSKRNCLNFYISHFSNNPDSIQYHYGFTEMNLYDVAKISREFKEAKGRYDRNRIFANVIIDKDIKMKHVYPLLEKFRKNDLLKVGFVTIREDENSREKYFSTFWNAINIRLPFREDFLHPLVEHLKKEPNSDRSTWQKYIDQNSLPWLMTPEDLELFYSPNYSIEILPNKEFKLNGEKITSTIIVESTAALLRLHINEPTSFYLKINPETTYGDYLFLHHEFKRAKFKIRNEIAYRKFFKNFEFLTYEQQKEIRAITPFFLREAYSAEEKFLYKFFQSKS